ncbi:hypothetical protein D3C74_300610 [compost metagenome]
MKYVRLFNEARTKDTVPGPVLVQWKITLRQIFDFDQFFVKESILLQENLVFFVVRIVHVVDDVLPFFRFFFFQFQLAYELLITRVFIRLQIFKNLKRIFHSPCCDTVSIPVVVNVVFVFVRSSHTKHYILLLVVGEIHALFPEAGDFSQHLKTVLSQIGFISCVVHVVVDCISNRAVTMNFFKGDFPFVMAFLTVHRYHWIKSTFGEAKLFSVFFSLLQVLVAVDEQVAGNFGIRCTEVERYAISFCIPVSTAAIFFTGEAFRTDV